MSLKVESRVEFAKEYEEYRQQANAERALLTREGMRRKAESGGVVAKTPLGYLNVRRGTEAWVEIDPVTAPLVREAFDLAATGKYSLRKLLAAITEKGLRSKSGKPLSVAGLHGMLGNAFYIGLVMVGANHAKGHHGSLVDPETFIRVQKAIARSKKFSYP